MSQPVIKIKRDWKEVFEQEEMKLEFSERILPGFLHSRRWFGAKSSLVKRYRVEQALPYKMSNGRTAYILFVEVAFQTSNTESYLLPVVPSSQPEDEDAIICSLSDSEGESKGFLVDAIYSKMFRNELFKSIMGSAKVKLVAGELKFSKGRGLKVSFDEDNPKSEVLKLEQSNSTILYEDSYFLKIYRKLFRDNNPDLELTRFLSEKTQFPHTPKFAGGIEWTREGYYTVSIGLMQERVENQGEAWNDSLREIQGFFDRVKDRGLSSFDLPKLDLYKPIGDDQVPEIFRELIGDSFLNKVRKLAIRTAEMHIALFSEKTDRHFTPDPFNSDYTVWLLNRIMYMFDNRYHLLEQNLNQLQGVAYEYAKYFLDNKDEVKNRILHFDELNLYSSRIRIHGDYHLGQILMKDGDFCILDFEGEPESTIRDRKVKQPPIKDLAGLFRSYHYATFAIIFNSELAGPELEDAMEVGGRFYRLVVGLALFHYVKTAMDNGLNIGYADEIDFLLRYHIFEKAIYEIGYELHSRPDWVTIPLKGLIQILKQE